MKITCIADLHGYYPKLEGGDLLIIAGDLTASDTEEQLHEFDYWLCDQPYKKKIFIAGNHDNLLIKETPRKYMMRIGKNSYEQYEYLRDSGTEFQGLKIWGSPWTKTFEGINPCCKAFTCDTERELAKKWVLIPEDIDILITHTPPFGMLDKTCNGKYVGSEDLGFETWKFENLKLHVFGHIHEAYGQSYQAYETKNAWDENPTPIGHLSVNCSHVNEKYQPVNKPVNIELR